MAYQAVYLKARHPAPYMTAVLNAGGGYYELAEYIEEAKRLGLRILGPDANRSGLGFEVEAGAIRVGLLSIKGLGRKTAERIIEARAEDGPYRSLPDALARLSPSKAELFTLVKAGVFDSLEARRTRQILRYVQGIEGLEPDTDLSPREKARDRPGLAGLQPGSRSAGPLRGQAAGPPDQGPAPASRPGRRPGRPGRGRPGQGCQGREEVLLLLRGRDRDARGRGRPPLPGLGRAARLLPARRGQGGRHGASEDLRMRVPQSFLKGKRPIPGRTVQSSARRLRALLAFSHSSPRRLGTRALVRTDLQDLPLSLLFDCPFLAQTALGGRWLPSESYGKRRRPRDFAVGRYSEPSSLPGIERRNFLTKW